MRGDLSRWQDGLLKRRGRVLTRRARVIAAALAPLAAVSMTAPSSCHNPPNGRHASRHAWTTVFRDDFTGQAGTPAGDGWLYDTGTRYPGTGCPEHWGTGEVESMTDSPGNVYQDGHGNLVITPLRSDGSWTSGRIETAASDFAAPAGGEMQVTASIMQPNPRSGLGYWPAFWMLGAGFRGTSGTTECLDYPAVGEIDVLEDVNALSKHAGTLHCGILTGGPCRETTGLTSGLRPCPRCQTRYNTYSVIIDRTRRDNESITWYRNGRAYFTVTERRVGKAAWQAAVDHGFFLILDVAIGGGYPNAVCRCLTPSDRTTPGAPMRVSYVAVATKSP